MGLLTTTINSDHEGQEKYWNDFVRDAKIWLHQNPSREIFPHFSDFLTTKIGPENIAAFWNSHLLPALQETLQVLPPQTVAELFCLPHTNRHRRVLITEWDRPRPSCTNFTLRIEGEKTSQTVHYQVLTMDSVLTIHRTLL